MQEIPKNNIQIINNGEKSYDEKKQSGVRKKVRKLSYVYLPCKE